MKTRLENVRMTFPQLFEAKQVNNQGDPKFGASFIIPKDHPQLKEIQKAIMEAAAAKWKDKATEVLKGLKAADRLPVHDGDTKPNYDGYPGAYFINASNRIRPLSIGADRGQLSATDGKMYSGCYVNAMIEFWAQDNQFGKRVNASLLGVQFVKDGERLAGGGSASADDFEAIPTGDAEKAAKSGDGAASLF